MGLVYAKTGITFDAGQGFIFTGNSNTYSAWEIDLPSANGKRIHGVTSSFVDEFSNYTAFTLGQGPLYIGLSTNITAGDELAVDSSGNFYKRTASDALAGLAITSGVANNSCIALVFALDTPFNITSLIQGDILVRGSSSWQRLSPSTSGYVLTSNGSSATPTYQNSVGSLLQTASAKVTADQTTTSSTLVDLTGASVTLTTSASTKLLIGVSYSMSNASALGSTNRIALVIDGTVETNSGFTTPLISNVLQGGGFSILKTGLSAGSHTIKLQWSNTTGTTQCRPVTAAPTTEHASITVMEVKV